MTHALDNYQWAEGLINGLLMLGCQHFFIAPGSRSAPLSMACLRRVRTLPDGHSHTHFDERSLAFAALGAAKASHKPSVIITSSGSAVGNLLPAVIEAFQTQTPLILLTADRPPELVGCGANQAIAQPGIFSHFTQASLNLPLPETDRSTSLQRVIQQLSECLHGTPGPIHLNVPFREPLYSNEPAHPALALTMPEVRPAPVNTPVTHAITAPVLIIAGHLQQSEAAQVLALAETLQAPIIADIGSQLRLLAHPLICPAGHFLMARPTPILQQVQTVLQFGGHLTSKPLQQWLDRFTGDYRLIDTGAQPLDPGHHARQLQVAAHHWPVSFSLHGHNMDFSEAFMAHAHALWLALAPERQAVFSEVSCCALISDLLPPAQNLFAANSLTIRLFDQWASVRPQAATVCTNRGASGIDGLLATATGYAIASQQPTTAVLGDLAALYDLNSLYWLRQSQIAVTLIVLNNDGGQIFSMLPAARQADVFNHAFLQPHGLGFAQFSEGFGLPYQRVHSLQQLADAYAHGLSSGHSNVIEVQLPENAFLQHQQQISRILDTFCYD